MKKILFIMLPILLLLQVAYPACWAASIYMDLYFQAYCPEVFATATVALMMIGAVLAWRCRLIRSKYYNIFCALMLPPAIISGAIFFLELSWYMTLVAGLNVACMVTLFYFSNGIWKLFSGIFTCLMTVQILVVCGIGLIITMEAMPSVTVIEEYPSPDGTYTAQVVVLDGGGRGADTNVELYDHSRDVELLIGKLWLREERIYSGEWLDYETITVRWSDENTLIINDEIYEIS